MDVVLLLLSAAQKKLNGIANAQEHELWPADGAGCQGFFIFFSFYKATTAAKCQQQFDCYCQ